jgi:predicted nucleotidyltransferase
MIVNKIRHMSNKLDIGILFVSDYSLKLTGREVARKVGLSPQIALNNLNNLVKEKIFLVEKQGRNNLFGLNLKDFGCLMFLSLVEEYRGLGSLKNKELKGLVEELLPLAETLIVFGSFASGKQGKDSDIDLIALGVKDRKKFNKVKRSFPREVNVEFLSWREFKKACLEKKALAVEVAKNHLVYGNVFNLVKTYKEIK